MASATAIVETGMMRQDEQINETMKYYQASVESACASLQKQIDSVNLKLENLIGGIQIQVKASQSNEVAQESTLEWEKVLPKKLCDSSCCISNAKPRPPDMNKVKRKLS